MCWTLGTSLLQEALCTNAEIKLTGLASAITEVLCTSTCSFQQAFLNQQGKHAIQEGEEFQEASFCIWLKLRTQGHAGLSSCHKGCTGLNVMGCACRLWQSLYSAAASVPLFAQ